MPRATIARAFPVIRSGGEKCSKDNGRESFETEGTECPWEGQPKLACFMVNFSESTYEYSCLPCQAMAKVLTGTLLGNMKGPTCTWKRRAGTLKNFLVWTDPGGCQSLLGTVRDMLATKGISIHVRLHRFSDSGRKFAETKSQSYRGLECMEGLKVEYCKSCWLASNI